LSRDNASIKEYGYGRSHADTEYMSHELLNESGREEEANAEIDRTAMADEERAQEKLLPDFSRGSFGQSIIAIDFCPWCGTQLPQIENGSSGPTSFRNAGLTVGRKHTWTAVLFIANTFQ